MAKSIPSARHQAALPPNAETVGFARQLGELGIRLGKRRVVPDAFRFEHHRKTIRLFEVVVTHPLGAEKMARLRELRDGLAAIGWRLRVVACAMDARYRNVDWDSGEPLVSDREMGAAVALLGGLFPSR
jgi:hypothetical protein